MQNILFLGWGTSNLSVGSAARREPKKLVNVEPSGFILLKVPYTSYLDDGPKSKTKHSHRKCIFWQFSGSTCAQTWLQQCSGVPPCSFSSITTASLYLTTSVALICWPLTGSGGLD
jgi:hypothetical protein